MEQLEDTVQDFRVRPHYNHMLLEFCVIEPLGFLQELSLDLDSHKNIVMSLNIVVNHVAEHAVTADQRAADRLRSRLAAANSRWDAVCKSAARIQARLQSSLMQVIVKLVINYNISGNDITFERLERRISPYHS
jgi:nesprin-1